MLAICRQEKKSLLIDSDHFCVRRSCSAPSSRARLPSQRRAAMAIRFAKLIRRRRCISCCRLPRPMPLALEFTASSVADISSPSMSRRASASSNESAAFSCSNSTIKARNWNRGICSRVLRHHLSNFGTGR